jgi:SHQ1 protein
MSLLLSKKEKPFEVGEKENEKMLTPPHKPPVGQNTEEEKLLTLIAEIIVSYTLNHLTDEQESSQISPVQHR